MNVIDSWPVLAKILLMPKIQCSRQWYLFWGNVVWVSVWEQLIQHRKIGKERLGWRKESCSDVMRAEKYLCELQLTRLKTWLFSLICVCSPKTNSCAWCNRSVVCQALVNVTQIKFGVVSVRGSLRGRAHPFRRYRFCSVTSLCIIYNRPAV